MTARRQAIEAMLAEQPDDAATQAAYADFLVDEGDPRGEYIQLQMAQTDLHRPVHLRRQLELRINQLYQQHERAWLGGLAPFLLDPTGRRTDPRAEPQGEFSWHCGWIDQLTIPWLSLRFAEAVAVAPELRLLRELNIHHTRFAERQNPQAREEDRLAALLRAEYLGNLRCLRLGNFESWGCSAGAAGLENLLARLPRLEELAVAADGLAVPAVFGLPLPNLTRLRLDFLSSVPLEILAANPSLTRLHTLSLDLRANERAAEDGMPLPTGVRDFAHSPNLRGVRHLRLRVPNFGDEGVARLIATGWLTRLDSLDLRGATLGDESAHLLAIVPATTRLQRLDVGQNFLTAEGIAALEALDLPVLLTDQQNNGPPDAGAWDGAEPF
jgi:uncharacterized protein (TIGR02996 family)